MKGFRLEDPLQWREKDDEQLAANGQGDGRYKQPVGTKSNFPNRFVLRPTAQRVEQIEQDEAGERHGRVARRQLVVLQLALEHEERAQHDNGRRHQDVGDERSVNHGLFAAARRLPDHVLVDRFDAETLSWWTVH